MLVFDDPNKFPPEDAGVCDAPNNDDPPDDEPPPNKLCPDEAAADVVGAPNKVDGEGWVEAEPKTLVCWVEPKTLDEGADVDEGVPNVDEEAGWPNGELDDEVLELPNNDDDAWVAGAELPKIEDAAVVDCCCWDPKIDDPELLKGEAAVETGAPNVLVDPKVDCCVLLDPNMDEALDVPVDDAPNMPEVVDELFPPNIDVVEDWLVDDPPNTDDPDWPNVADPPNTEDDWGLLNIDPEADDEDPPPKMAPDDWLLLLLPPKMLPEVDEGVLLPPKTPPLLDDPPPNNADPLLLDPAPNTDDDDPELVDVLLSLL